MFKNNLMHGQTPLFATQYEMNERLKRELKDHWSNPFYTHIFNRIDETLFKELYHPTMGRNNFPVNILVSLEIIKEMEHLTDKQVLDQHRFNLSYRNAMGLEDINEHLIAPRTLYYFRSSIAEHELKHSVNLMELCFAKLRDQIIEVFGIKTDMQRGDSVMIGGNIKKMGRLMLFHKCTSNLVKELKKSSASISEDVKEAVSEKEDSFVYHLQENDYDSKLLWLSETLWGLVREHLWDVKIRKSKAYKQAVRLLKDQCKIESNTANLILKERGEISSGALQNPADEECTYRKKGGEKYHGFKTQALETCASENSFQVVTDIRTEKNNVDDSDMLREQLKNMPENLKPSIAIGDGGLITSKVRKEFKEIKMIQTGIRGTKIKDMKERVKLSDFSYDEKGNVLLCPEGHAPRSVSVDSNRNKVANFNPKLCRNCKRKSQCVVTLTKKQSRLVLTDNLRSMDELSESMRDEVYWDLARKRPEVEGLMGLLKGGNLTSRIMFRGIARINTRMFLRGIAINFNRMKNYLINCRKESVMASENV